MTGREVRAGEAAAYCDALQALVEDAGIFLRSAAGIAFVARLTVDLSPSVRREVRRVGGPLADDDDYGTFVLLHLIEDPGLCRDAVNAVSPRSFIAKSLREWVFKETQLGVHRFKGGRDGVYRWASAVDIEEGEYRNVWNDDPLEILIRDELLPRAADALVSRLWSRTPDGVRPHLWSLVSWMAVNPPAKSYEREAIDAAAGVFPLVSRDAAALVSSIMWGTRPKQDQTALFPRLVADLSFDVADSPTHYLALRSYHAKFRSLAAASSS